MKLSEITRLIGGHFAGGADIEISGVAKIEEAEPGDITFLSNPKYRKHLATTAASAVIIARGSSFPEELNRRTAPIALVPADDPYSAFLQVVDHFHPAPAPPPRGVHPSAVIAPSAILGPEVAVGPHVVIGERTTVGRGTIVGSGTSIGDDVRIGGDCLLYANVTVREQCTLGDRVIVHPGAVIGSDGFGFAPRADGTYEKIAQRGTVVIGDDVEIGANTAIDRATIGETRIGSGVKLDNLIHIAHNVTVGDHTVMAAQTGVSGSTKVGSFCAFGGQVGLSGHIQIADRTRIGAQSGVHKSVDETGKTYFGYPARELHETLRIEGALVELPELLREVRRLKERIDELEQLLHQSPSV
jgi:UDP-3-O-[3-hydroxymyristoyl] glucosamine N-acyltransferase